MNYTDYRLSLDIFKTVSQATLPVKQGDTAYRICVTITANGTPYRITEGCYALFTAKKPDGNFINNKCTIENNIIYYQLTPQTTAAIGMVECEIVLYDANDAQLATPHFNILVDKKAYNGEDIKSSSENGVLGSLVEYANRAEEARDKAEEYMDSAGDACVAAQDAERFAEKYKGEAAESATKASNEALKAEGFATTAEVARDDAQEYRRLAQQNASKAQIAAEKTEALLNTANNFSNALKGTANGEVIGMHDVSPIEHEMGVKVSGKNLCDNVYESGSISSDNGTEYPSSDGIRSKKYLPIKPNTTYTIKSVDSTPNIRFRFYDRDKNYIGYIFSVVTNGKVFTFTTTAESYFLRFDIAYGNLDTKLQLEYGTVASAYAPYIPDISAVKVKKYGKNIIDYTKVEPRIAGQTVVINEENKSVVWSGNYFFKIPLGFTVKAGTEISFSCIASKFHRLGFANTSNSNNDVVSEDAVTSNGICIITQIAPIDFNMIYLYKRDATIFEENIVFEKIQLEIGNAPTEYNNYIQPTEYTPDADGVVSGVTSLYPSTTLMTDTDGALIDATYNKDINKAFEEIKNAILSLGGNV